MGLFKKKEPEVKATAKVVENELMKARVSTVLKSLPTKTKFEITLSHDKPNVFDSKFGGLPYLGKDDQVPVNSENKQLRLLAQINLNDLPDNKYLKQGILQFWILNDDLYGLDFDDMLSQAGSRVVYYPVIDETVDESEIEAKYHPYQEDDYFPIDGEFKLQFTKKTDSLSMGDFEFDTRFVETWNKLYPDKRLNSYYDLPDEVLYADEFNDFSGFGHKVFGYPAFTQEDPRAIGKFDDYILLLQIDSIGLDGYEIMWGDSGVCNFFIRKEDLLNKDFTKVLYNWDCY